MRYQETTQVPNVVFDTYLPILSGSEYKVLSIIIRQTYGWIDKNTGKRKTRDRISHGQFMQKSGLSRRVISQTIKSLVNKGIVTVGDRDGNALTSAPHRKGLSHLYYGMTQRNIESKSGNVQCIGEMLRGY